MRSEYTTNAAAPEGVIGPEILLNPASGHACLRMDDGSLRGQSPEAPYTNAFVVWLGYPVAVISAGVAPVDLSSVAQELRRALEHESLPIVANQGRLPSGDGARCISFNPGQLPARELARAEAYVLAQRGWEEGQINVELDGQPFVFELEFQANADGNFMPRIR
ncbi:MAG TPA: hypothetical protein VGI10_14585 [Polyangiaceae bacterium]|jgi:hypothetical protein